MEELPKTYQPKSVEEKWYNFWTEKEYFKGIIIDSQKPFSIVIPPPNVTGSLHIGHALNNTIQDIVIRKHRMKGKPTLWLPGTDHAGIATQNVVEQQLASEGKTRQDLGREKFVEMAWQWKEKYGHTIIKQLKKMGFSCDWSRERFTLDKGLSKAVKEVFIRLYEEGLIYRGNYIINWCPRCHTALSDIEVEHHELKGNLYYIKYPLKDEPGYVSIATTRPETLLGDTAVAVNPNDKRFKDLIGKKVILPVLEREIPIIADEYVDMDFGAGALKVTPGHDVNDFEIGQRHGLPVIDAMTESGKMSSEAGPYEGMDRFEAREKIVEELKEEQLIDKIEDYTHSIGHCYRCDTIIEPRISLQWFIKMKPLAEPAIKAVEEGRIVFIPENWTKVYYEWMHSIKDWCISRQLWWGHRIPAWYCKACGEVIVSREEPSTCSSCQEGVLEQDKDVLDTWFSSALWPFSTLGWPKKTKDLDYFYPTSLLVTSHDIIYFWVARMIMMGLHFMNDIPFKEVYIHPLVRDAKGQKMSKSRGNVIDPLDVIGEYGTDALRFTLSFLTVPGRNIFLSKDRIEGFRNFANKIWNASRFVLMNLDGFEQKDLFESSEELNIEDRWILSILSELTKKVNLSLSEYNFGKAAKALYEFFWSEYCDWYLEIVKFRLYEKNDKNDRILAQNVLVFILERLLRLLHPMMPFITEEIWQKLPLEKKEGSIMVSSWPEDDLPWSDLEAIDDISVIKDVITSIRSIRSDHRIPLDKRVPVIIRTDDKRTINNLTVNKEFILRLANVNDIEITSEAIRPEKSSYSVVGDIEIYVSLKGLINIEEEKQRLVKEYNNSKNELMTVEKKLNNEGFTGKAPQEVIDKVREQAEELKDKIEKFEQKLNYL